MVTRRSYAGAAAPATLSANITAGSTSITISDATGWPDGTGGPFWVTIARGQTDEEHVLVTSRSSTVLTAGTRGGDGTVAGAHSSGATIEHTSAAQDFDEANSHASDTPTTSHAASKISFTPTGGVAATTVQAALAEIDTDWRAQATTIPHTWAITGNVNVASGDVDFIVPFFVPVPAGQAVAIRSARYVINSGTSATVKLQKNGVDVAGLTGISVTTTAATTTQAASLANNDKLALVVTAVSGTPKNMTFTVYLDYTAA